MLKKQKEIENPLYNTKDLSNYNKYLFSIIETIYYKMKTNRDILLKYLDGNFSDNGIRVSLELAETKFPPTYSNLNFFKELNVDKFFSEFITDMIKDSK